MSKSRQPRRPSKASLENVALFYLERFAASAEQLRRVLVRRIERAARQLDEEPAAGLALVDDLIARYRASGLLDDRQYAGARSRSLLRRGTSTRGIRQHLAARGVASDDIEAALAELGAELGAEPGADADGDPDLAAAFAYARRRRLGPYRPAPARADCRLKDLATLGRAGFSFAIARAVVDCEEAP